MADECLLNVTSKLAKLLATFFAFISIMTKCELFLLADTVIGHMYTVKVRECKPSLHTCAPHSECSRRSVADLFFDSPNCAVKENCLSWHHPAKKKNFDSNLLRQPTWEWNQWKIKHPEGCLRTHRRKQQVDAVIPHFCEETPESNFIEDREVRYEPKTPVVMIASGQKKS